MVNEVIGQKKGMRQVWTQAGVRLPVTQVVVKGNTVVRAVASSEEAQRVQIAFGDKKLKNMAQPTVKQLEKAGITEGKRMFKEVTVQPDSELQPGQTIRVEDVFSVGDVIKVTGTTKGRGFAGVVKRYGFAGGPQTHGQSDRERAPGSIGQGTTPGRVYKGKRMPGHYGIDTQTLETCVIVAVDTATQSLWLKGTLPGSYNGFLTLAKQDAQNVIELNQQSKEELLQIQPEKEAAEAAQAEEAQETETAPEVQTEEVATESPTKVEEVQA